MTIKQHAFEPIKAFQGEYRWLSNFHLIRITYDGLTYPSTENAYQAQKTLNLKIRELFTCMAPAEAKRHSRLLKIRADWEDVKVQVMRDVTRLKYLDRDLADLLIDTYPRELIEGNTWGDKFWGQCSVGKGRNMLGQIIMEVREKLVTGELK